jgi:hypothetical protein
MVQGLHQVALAVKWLRWLFFHCSVLKQMAGMDLNSGAVGDFANGHWGSLNSAGLTTAAGNAVWTSMTLVHGVEFVRPTHCCRMCAQHLLSSRRYCEISKHFVAAPPFNPKSGGVVRWGTVAKRFGPSYMTISPEPRPKTL